VPPFLGAEKQRERSNVGGLAEPAQTVFGGGLLLQLFDLPDAFDRCSNSRAGVDDINIHAWRLPS
jgi:hypothetical protein